MPQFDNRSVKRIAKAVQESERRRTRLVAPPARRAWPTGITVLRAKVTDFADQTNDPGILLCTPYQSDGVTLVDTDPIPVIGMEPHVKDDDLLIWNPPGGAMGREYNSRRENGYPTAPNVSPQEYLYSVTGEKVVSQEFMTRREVMVWHSGYPDDAQTIPYLCRWGFIRDGDSFGQGTRMRLGRLAKSEENQYQRYGPTSNSLWDKTGAEETPMIPAMWTGEYTTVSSVVYPVFLAGHTPHTGTGGGATLIPGFDDQSWGIKRGSGDPVITQGTSGSHPATMNGYASFKVAVPGGKFRILTFDSSGCLILVEPAV